MNRITSFLVVLLSLVLSGCLPQVSTYQEASPEEGEVVVYLQPLTQEASNLRFSLSGISALRDEGAKIPLTLVFREVIGPDLAGKQKRLAFGFLSEGSYTGLSIKVDRAFLRGEEGESALLVPEESLTVDCLFKVKRKRALALFLSFNASGAVTGGIRFTPDFSLSVAERELSDLSGYVSNSASDNLSVFNKKTMEVVATISTGKGPKGLVLDRRSGRVYVALSGEDAVEVIDIIEGRDVGRVTLNFRDEPVDLALTPDGSTLLSVNPGSNTVSIIDALSLFEVRRIRVGDEPVSAVLGPSGRKAYVLNALSGSLSVVDLTGRIPPTTLPVEGAPLRGSFNRNGDRQDSEILDYDLDTYCSR